MTELLSNKLEIYEYLQSHGWRVSKSAVYNHAKEGKIRPDKAGKFPIAAVEKYAALNLKRLDGSAPASDEADSIQLAKAADEARKMKAVADMAELKAATLRGQLVDKSIFEEELAARATVFRSDLVNFIHADAPELIAVVHGDARYLPDAIKFFEDALEGVLARYLEQREFEAAPAAPSPGDQFSDDDEILAADEVPF